jgi:hypothetical protein
VARLGGGALADDPVRRRAAAVSGYTSTAVLSSLIGAATAAWQVGVLRAGAWASRGLRVPARNALLADVVAPTAYSRAYGFERFMDNPGAIGGPLLALALVAALNVRSAILISAIPGLLATGAILYAIRHTPAPTSRIRQSIRLQVQPVLRGRLGRLLIAVGAFELGNVAATLFILRATQELSPAHGTKAGAEIALVLYTAYNVAATSASIPACAQFPGVFTAPPRGENGGGCGQASSRAMVNGSGAFCDDATASAYDCLHPAAGRSAVHTGGQRRWTLYRSPVPSPHLPSPTGHKPGAHFSPPVWFPVSAGRMASAFW